jgi:DNA-binding transcriptional regulator YiaG
MTATPNLVYSKAKAATPETEPAKNEIDPKSVREKADLSQDEMAALMGMSAFGYKSWEDGVRRPGGPAFQLLRMIDKDPAAAISTLR